MIKKQLFDPINVVVLFIIVMVASPLFYYGQDSIISVFDNLDGFIPWMKMLKDNGLLFSIDSPTPVLGNMSTAYSINCPFNILYPLYYFFDIFTAHILGYIINIIVGYFSMYVLLKHLFPEDDNNTIVKLVSLSFALLPIIPAFWLGVASIPLACYAFLRIMNFEYKSIDKRVFLLLAYPLFSSFTFSGIFILFLWILSFIVIWVLRRKFNINILVGFVCLAIGYILTNLRLFYAIFLLREPLNRQIFEAGITIGQALEQVLETYFGYFSLGGEVTIAPNIINYFILPTIFITLISSIAFILHKLIRQEYKNDYHDLARFSLRSIILIGISVFLVLIASMFSTNIFYRIVDIFFPFLRGFSWVRLELFNRTVFYVCFALSLIALLRYAKSGISRLLIYALAGFQIVAVLTSPGIYNYFWQNLNHSKTLQMDSSEAGRYIVNNHVTFREFFAEELFDYIKKDIDYDGEGVAALGFHPSVLMYNGFSSIDGYNSSYPLEYMMAFREIIAPQLELNDAHRQYYDSWGGRMYLYSDDIYYVPTRDKPISPVSLNINTDAFRRLGGTYILSRAELSNTEETGLELLSFYNSTDSIYEIYVYFAA